MELHLDGQVAVVIGGASGIGLAIAKEFAREGCRVAIVDRSEQTDAQARNAGLELGKSVVGIRADVTDYGAVQTAASRVTSELGVASHVVYAAGMGSGKFGFP